MLSLELIIVLGALYSFFIYAALKTQRKNKEGRARPNIWERHVAPGNLTPEGTRHELAEENA